MTWQLHVRFQETELRDTYWEQVTAMPQVTPLLASSHLRTRMYLARPVVAFEHIDRETLASIARYTMDFWRTAQISLHHASQRIENLDEGAEIYLEAGGD